MNILILGSGAREHALYWKLSTESPSKPHQVWVMPGNGGIPNSVKNDWKDLASLGKFIKTEKIELVIAGGEEPIISGIGEKLTADGIKFFGPSAQAARLETSKVYAKEFMQKYGVKTAYFWKFTCKIDEQCLTTETSYSLEEVNDPIIKQAWHLIKSLNGNCVIKYDGLAQGKGVFVCQDLKSAQTALLSLPTLAKKYSFLQNTNHKSATLNPSTFSFIIEEKLEGVEVSITVITDGHTYQLLPSSQDHKTLYEKNIGPNTGGLGAVSPVKFLQDHPSYLEQITKDIIQPTMNGISAENLSYRGILYFGVMICADGPKLLEYNARLGDPEAQVILPAIKSELLPRMLATIDGHLKDYPPLSISQDTFINVVFASEGYPQAPKFLNQEINISSNISKDALLFFSSVRKNSAYPHTHPQLLTNGGRVLGITGRAKDFDSCRLKTYTDCEKINFKGCHYRKDIGNYSLSNKILNKIMASSRKKKLAVFISGRGSNLQAILENSLYGNLQNLAEIVLVASDRPAEGLNLALKHNIPSLQINRAEFPTRHDFEKTLLTSLEQFNSYIDFIVLAGFKSILSAEFLSHYPQRIINIHPADPAKYRGASGYQWAFKNRLESTLITVHLVDQGVDTGPILAQESVDLRGTKSLEEVMVRGLEVEHKLYSKVLALICTNTSDSAEGSI